MVDKDLPVVVVVENFMRPRVVVILVVVQLVTPVAVVVVVLLSTPRLGMPLRVLHPVHRHRAAMERGHWPMAQYKSL